MTWYSKWFGTPYYALLYGHRDAGEAQPWANAILTEWDLAPSSKLLDMACGRGRHAIWFAEHGMEVTGIDISEQSIREAELATELVQFHVHDMRIPFAKNEFDGAYCLFTSLGYSDTLEDDRKVFKAVAHALRPGGRFVLDFMNTHAVLRDLVRSEELVRNGLHFKIDRECKGGILIKRIQVQDGEEIHLFEERVQALLPEQLKRMAQEAGLVVDSCTDGPNVVPFDQDRSDRFVMWTHKPQK